MTQFKKMKVRAKSMKKTGVVLAIAVLLSVSVLPARSAVYSWVETSQADFSRGSFSSATSTASGDIVLTRNQTVFSGGTSFFDSQSQTTDSLRQVASGGSIKLGGSHSYTSSSSVGYHVNEALSAGKKINHTHYSATTGFLLLSTNSGLTVIDTKKTVEPSDDVLVADYSAANGVFKSDAVYSSFYDDTLGLIFASTDGDGVAAINPATQPASDALVATYFSGKANSAFLNRDSGNSLLYVSTDSGLYIIDIGDPFQGEVGTQILRLSDTNNDPVPPVFQSQSAHIVSQGVNSAFLIDTASSSILFINTNNGISVVDLGGKSINAISSTTSAALVDNFLVAGLSADSSGSIITASSSAKLSGQNVKSSFLDLSSGKNFFFAGTASGVTIIDLGDIFSGADDAVVENIVSATNAQNLSANDPSTLVTISNISLPEDMVVSDCALSGGKMYIGNTDGDSLGSLMAISIGDILSPSDDSLSAVYDASSTTSLIGNAVADIYIDGNNIYAGTDKGLTVIHPGAYNRVGEYHSLPISVSSSAYFTSISSDITATANQTAVVESRYGDGLGNWTDWQMGSDISGIYTATSTVFEYKITLTSQSSASTPVVNSITLSSPYGSSGSYSSMVYDASSTVVWKNISLYAENTANTNVTVETRTGSSATPSGSWSNWWPVSGTAIPSPNGRYFQYRLNLSTTKPNETPILHSVTVGYEDVPTTQTTTTTTNTTSTTNTSSSGNTTQTTTSLPPIQTATSTQANNQTVVKATTTLLKIPAVTESIATDGKNAGQGQVKGVKILGGIMEAIAAEAQILNSGDVNSVLTSSGKKRSIIAEFENYFKFVKNIFKAEKKLTEDNLSGILNYIVYGTGSTKKMSVDDRTNILNTYRDAYASSPKTDSNWLDVLKMSNGQAPSQLSKKAEDKAKLNFRIVYKRNPDMKNANDALAVKIMAYGIYTPARNLKAEAEAVKKFKKTYGYSPKNFSSWNVVRGIAYSGIKK